MNYEPFTSIENPTLAHFRHFSSLFTLSPLYICREPSTNQLLFMQNKPNFKDALMNVNTYYTKVYKNETAFRRGKNKPNSNPIKPNSQKAKMNVNLTLTKDYRKNDCLADQKTNPIQTQSNPVLSAPVLSKVEGVEWANFFKGQNRLPENPATTTYRTSSGSLFDIVPKCL